MKYLVNEFPFTNYSCPIPTFPLAEILLSCVLATCRTHKQLLELQYFHPHMLGHLVSGHAHMTSHMGSYTENTIRKLKRNE